MAVNTDRLFEELDALAESLGLDGEDSSAALASDLMSDLDDEFGDLTQIASREEPRSTRRSQALSRLAAALEQASQIVANLGDTTVSDREERRQELESHVQTLEEFQSRTKALLDRIEQRLQRLRQELNELGQ